MVSPQFIDRAALAQVFPDPRTLRAFETVLQRINTAVTPEPTIADYGAVKNDPTLDSLAAFEASAAQDATVRVPEGDWYLSATFNTQGKNLICDEGATIHAMAGFVGSSLIEIGSLTSAPEFWWALLNLNCHQHCNYGVTVVRGRFGKMRASVTGALVKGVWVGSDATYNCGDIHLMDGTEVLWWTLGQVAPIANGVGSIGIDFRCDDGVVGNVTAIGYRTGVALEGGDVKGPGLIHVWTWVPWYGPMVCGVDVKSSLINLNQVYSDTPTSGGDATLLPIYGIRFRRFSSSVTDLRVLINGSGGGLDNEVTGIYCDLAANQTLIKSVTFNTSNVAIRFAKYVDGHIDPQTDRFNVINWLDDGRVVSSAGRVSAFTNLYGYRITTQLTLNASPVLDMPAGNLRAVRIRTNGLERWTAGANSEAETGANAGSNYRVDAYDDAGAYLSTPFQIVRSIGRVDLGDSTAAGPRVKFNTDTVAGATGGAATALPAKPVGYLVVNINGALSRIPYYDP